MARRDSCLPEQLRGLDIDARSDIFSLGVTLYDARPAIRDARGTPIDVSLRVVTDTSPPSVVDRAVPPALDAIVARAMAKDPAARYGSARRFTPISGLKQELNGATPRPASTALSTATVRRASVRFEALIAAGAVTALLTVWIARVSATRATSPARGRHLVQPRHQRHSRQRVLSSRARRWSAARDRRRVRSGAGRGRKPTRNGPHPSGREDCSRPWRCYRMVRLCRPPSRSIWTRSTTLGATARRRSTSSVDHREFGSRRNSLRPMSISAARMSKTRISIAPSTRSTATSSIRSPTPPSYVRAFSMAVAGARLPKATDACRAEGIYQASRAMKAWPRGLPMGSLLARNRKLPEAKEHLERSLAMSRGSSSGPKRSGPRCN